MNNNYNDNNSYNNYDYNCYNNNYRNNNNVDDSNNVYCFILASKYSLALYPPSSQLTAQSQR